MLRRGLCLLLTLSACGCGGAPAAVAPRASGAPAAVAPRASGAPSIAEPEACCRDDEQLRALDGRRVRLEGTYQPVILQKRIGKLQEPPPGTPANVAIELPGGRSVMLEIYHGPKGMRPVEEVDRLRGKRVRVVGTLHAHTPSQVAGDGAVMQTMIGPYVGELERIEEM